MKQHIAVQQLQELTDEQKHKLNEWWMPHEGDIFILEELIDGIVRDSAEIIITDVNNVDAYNYICYGDFYLDSKHDCYPLLSIGQMIELLGYLSQEDNHEIGFKQKNNDIWQVDFFNKFTKSRISINSKTFCSKELCDTLWNIIKLVL